jgi:transglutaminase-like putative cysteine protease
MKTKLLSALFGFLLSVSFASAVLAAGATNAYEGALWGFLDAKNAMAAAGEISAEKFPDCDEATVDKRMVRVFRADGTGEAQDESFVKVLTEKGKRGSRSLRLSFMLPYFTAEVVKVEVIKPNGEAESVDLAANSKETIDDSQMAMNIYDPNMKILEVNVSKVEIGDVVHSITRMTTHRSIIPGEYAENNVFEGAGYIRHLACEIHAPADKPLKRIVLRDEIPGTVKYSQASDGAVGTIHRWEVGPVPRMFEEPAMPPAEMVLQRLLVSTTPDWESVSRWYWEVSKPHLDAVTPEMKKTVDELIANAKTDMDRIKSVFYYVSKTIRYMGITPEKDRPGFEPHDVKLTFENKHGVCRDKAALLVSMLQMAGVKAYPVLINVGLKMDAENPDPFFNHAIVGVELKKGDYVLMDPTDENTKDLLPSYDDNQSYLVSRPEGETIRTSPIVPPEENMMRVKTVALLKANGHLEAKSELWFEGANDNAYRGAFSQMKPDDRRRFFERNLKRAMPGATLQSLAITPDNMQDVTEAVKARIEFSAEGMIASGGGKAMANLPWIGKGMGLVNFILGGTGLEKRKYPMRTEVACGLREDISIQLDEAFTGAISMPSYPPVDDECVSYKQSASFQDKTLNCSRELKLKVVEFKPAQYLKLKRTLESLEYDERKNPVLALAKKSAGAAEAKPDKVSESPVESNAKVMESRKELDVKDAHTAVYKMKYAKRILTYKGKKEEAEVKIAYNPSCQEARLIHAAVISKTGQRQEISKDEVNIMDAGWNASAKRYTGGKIVVANLPGVDIGSTIEVEYEIASKGKPFLSGFESFQLFDDLEKKSFQLTAPEGMGMTNIVTGKTGIVKQSSGVSDGVQSFRFQSENVPALPAESQLPPEWVYMTGVGYFAGGMKSYLNDLQTALRDRSLARTKASEMAKKLTGRAKSKLEAVTAIRDFIAKSIRLAGPSFAELPLSELSPADTTLSEGYGHLADRAILFHAMLDAAGFAPEWVLASSLPAIPGITNIAMSFPLPHTFQSPLVKIQVAGEAYYLNDSDQYAKLGSTMFDGKLAIVLSSQAFEVVKAVPGCKDKVETAYTMSMADDSKARIGISRLYYGGHYNGKNKFFSELPPEERRRYYQELVSDVAQGARPVGELTTKFDAYPGVEQFTVEIDRYSVADGKYFYFDLPFTPALFPGGSDRRALPLLIQSQSEHSIRADIQLPPGFQQTVIAPRSENLIEPAGGGTARITSTDEKGKWVIQYQFNTSAAIVSPGDYPAMLQVESELGKKSSKVFLLEKK